LAHRILMEGTVTALRRLSALVVALLIGVVGSLATAGAASAAGSAPPPTPVSTVGPVTGNHVRYCVKNYEPNSTVTVTNQANGATVEIHTNSKGAGCAEVPVKRACGHSVTQTIVATGRDQNGNPASSQATVTAPPDKNLCRSVAAGGGQQGGGQSNQGGSLAFTGADIIGMILAALVLIALGTVAVVSARRRRREAAV
jgi:hypothetical protein